MYLIYLRKLFVQRLLIGHSLCLKWWGENGNLVFFETSFSDTTIKIRASKENFSLFKKDDRINYDWNINTFEF